MVESWVNPNGTMGGNKSWYQEREEEIMAELIQPNRQKPPEKATRYNNGKLKWSLPDYKALEPLIRVMMYGEGTVGRDNWKKGFNKKELLDSLLRHVLAIQNGEDIDPEHGISHIGGVLFNAMAYEYCRINNKFIE